MSTAAEASFDWKTASPAAQGERALAALTQMRQEAPLDSELFEVLLHATTALKTRMDIRAERAAQIGGAA